MSEKNWATAFELLNDSEGGLSDKPWDNGGLTNHGVTQGRYNEYRAKKGQPGRSVRAITGAEVHDVFHMIWDNVRAGELPSGLDYAVFDFAVNSGEDRAIRYLQTVVGAPVDPKGHAVFGPKTMGAVRVCNVVSVINVYQADRLAFLKRQEDWPKAGRGWENRVKSVLRHALALAAGG